MNSPSDRAIQGRLDIACQVIQSSLNPRRVLRSVAFHDETNNIYHTVLMHQMRVEPSCLDLRGIL